MNGFRVGDIVRVQYLGSMHDAKIVRADVSSDVFTVRLVSIHIILPGHVLRQWNSAGD